MGKRCASIPPPPSITLDKWPDGFVNNNIINKELISYYSHLLRATIIGNLGTVVLRFKSPGPMSFAKRVILGKG